MVDAIPTSSMKEVKRGILTSTLSVISAIKATVVVSNPGITRDLRASYRSPQPLSDTYWTVSFRLHFIFVSRIERVLFNGGNPCMRVKALFHVAGALCRDLYVTWLTDVCDVFCFCQY